jgi:beta-glucanase (GH16 family)
MASIKLLLGMIPSTSKIEQAEKALIDEFKKLQSFTESKQLARYNELNELVHSAGFIQKRKEIENLRYKNSEEYTREKEYFSLKKAKDIVLYFKTVDSDALKNFKELDGSDKIRKYEDLQHLVQSESFREKKKEKDFSGTEDARKLQEFNQMKSSVEIKKYYKFKSSKEYTNFVNTDRSARLSRLDELKEYISTKEFTERKAYLLDKKRFLKTEMFSELEEFKKLQKDPDIVWFFKVKDSNKFDLLKSRELTFSDEFDSDKVDVNKWLTNYYYGEKLLKGRYSVDPDLQYYTEKDNFEIRNSYLKIITREQKIKGTVWIEKHGFTQREFNYTSGLINSGKSFRQKYGIFSAKIKLGDPNARSAFWLLADKIAPHLDICRTGGGKVWIDFFPSIDNHAFKSSIGSRYSRQSHIFTLEWTSDKLVWKINGVEIAKQTQNVPQEPMYINIAGGLDKKIAGITSMELDWVRVYQFKS